MPEGHCVSALDGSAGAEHRVLPGAGGGLGIEVANEGKRARTRNAIMSVQPVHLSSSPQFIISFSKFRSDFKSHLGHFQLLEYREL